MIISLSELGYFYFVEVHLPASLLDEAGVTHNLDGLAHFDLVLDKLLIFLIYQGFFYT